MKKCNYKVSVTGAMVNDTESRMLNEEYIGDGIVVVVFKDEADGRTATTTCVSGNFNVMRIAKLFERIENAVGKEDFHKAFLLNQLGLMEASYSDEETEADE